MRKRFWCAFTKYALALLIAVCGEVLAQETTRPTFNFETGNPREVPTGWQVSRTGWTAKLQTGGAFAGKGCARLELPADSVARGWFGSLSFNLKAEPYRGTVVRYRVAVRITDRLEPNGRAANLWMRVDRKGSGEGFWDNAPPIREKKWRHYEIIGGVANDATEIACGIRLLKKGRRGSMRFLSKASGRLAANIRMIMCISLWRSWPTRTSSISK